MEKLQVYLNDLENRIDEETEAQLADDWLRFADEKIRADYFKPKRGRKAGSSLEWPKMKANDALKSYDDMICHELYRAHEQLRDGGGELLSFRGNYGTAILPSLFGAEVCIMPYEQDSLPCSRPLENAPEVIQKLSASGKKIDVKSGYALKPFEAAERLKELLKYFPKLSKYLYIYMPDTQGPASIMEALFGSGFYLMFYDDPGLVHRTLELTTDVFIRYARAWHQSFPPFDEAHQVDWGLLHRGHSLIRNDSVTNVSADIYKEFIFPCDQRILNEFGGGVIHFCGHGDHLVPYFAELKGIQGINLSQPGLNNMDLIYQYTIERGIPILGLANSEVNRCLREGRELKGLVHAGLSIAAWMPDTEDVPDIPAQSHKGGSPLF